jgi:prevent-host-death family protein
MAIINMHDAKTQLSDLVARAEAGEEIVIARRNLPAVKLVPVGVVAVTGFEEEGQMGLSDDNLTSSAALPAPQIDPWEHAPDDYISKEDIAAFYRKYPHEWLDMRQRVGPGSEKAQPVNKGKPRVPGRFAHLGASLPADLFFEPLDEDELAAWEGKYSDPSTP